MDSLYWKKLIPDIKIVPSTQLFYKQYVYRLELQAYAGKCISNPATIEETLALRNISYRKINYGGSWGAKVNRNLKNADVEWLKYLQSFRLANLNNLKIRIEEPAIQIYSSDEQDLVNFVRDLPAEFKKYVTSISRPESDQTMDLILSGKKVVKKHPTYEFKICFRDGNYSYNVRNDVMNYLDSLDDLVRIPKHFREQFTKSYDTIWDCYIYSNDLKLATFIQLINPNLIRTIIEMATVNKINTIIIKDVQNGQNT